MIIGADARLRSPIDHIPLQRKQLISKMEEHVHEHDMVHDTITTTLAMKC